MTVLSASGSGSGSAKAKKKKVKKLVLEGGGVPMSVRWLVWMELVASSSATLPAAGQSSGVMGGGLGGGGPGGRNAEALRALLDTVEGEGAERLKQAYRRMCPDVGWGDGECLSTRLFMWLDCHGDGRQRMVDKDV